MSNEFRQARTDAGLSRQAMSDLTQIPKRTIENWENGTNTPPEYVKRLVINELRRIAKKGKSNNKPQKQ